MADQKGKLIQDKGIPADLTIERARNWVSPRVSQYRFKHVEGVAQIARELAEHAGCDPFVAELGGWLHDACKEHKDKQLVEKKQTGIFSTAQSALSRPAATSI